MKKFLFSAVAVLALAATQLSAAQLTGRFDFGGATIISPVNTSTTVLSFSVNPVGDTTLTTGDLAVPVGTDVTFAPGLNLDSTNLSAYSFSGGGVTFTPTGFYGATFVQVPIPGIIAVQLFGLWSKAGFEDTNGTLDITFQGNTAATAEASVYTYSASGNVVPEPSTYAMLGTALLGLGLLRRRK